MRALVLGATGHVGNAAVRELLDRGYEVTAVTRRAEVPLNLRGLPVQILRGDADRPGQIRRWVKGYDAVIDGAAPYPLHLYVWEDGSPLGKAEDRTRELLDAVAEHGARLAYVGSFVTHPRRRRPGSDLARRHPYFRIKERIESMVLAAARAGVPAAVVNPTACYGPWDLKDRGLCLVPQVLCGEVPALARHLINVVDVRDVAIAVVSAIEEERFGEPILLCGHDVMLDELGARICALGGRRPPPWRTPANLVGLGVAASRWTDALFALGGRPSPWPSLTLSISLLYEFFPMKPGAAQRALGASPRPLMETLRDSVDWYRRIGYC